MYLITWLNFRQIYLIRITGHVEVTLHDEGNPAANDSSIMNTYYLKVLQTLNLIYCINNKKSQLMSRQFKSDVVFCQ